jgi:hypothetical protein
MAIRSGMIAIETLSVSEHYAASGIVKLLEVALLLDIVREIRSQFLRTVEEDRSQSSATRANYIFYVCGLRVQ